MAAHHSPIAVLAKPLGGICSCLSRMASQLIERKIRRARLVQLNNLLSRLDPHILKDIGMEGFNRLAPEQKLHVLLNRSHADPPVQPQVRQGSPRW